MSATLRDVRNQFIAAALAEAGVTLLTSSTLRPGVIRPRQLRTQGGTLRGFVDVVAAAEPAPFIFGGSSSGQDHRPRLRLSVLGETVDAYDPPYAAALQVLQAMHANPPTGWIDLVALDGEPILEVNEDPGEVPVYRVDFRGHYEEA